MNAMVTIACTQCGAPVERYKCQMVGKGLTRAFCDMKCLGLFRRTQTGPAAGRWTHGGKGTRLYRIWRGMKNRCNNPRFPEYYLWGGRGIKVCELWIRSFVSFRRWSLAHGYADDLQIDRRNNNKGYNPQNCRWVTPKVNSNNKRNSKRPALP